MKYKQRILFIPVFIVLVYGIYTSVIKIQANRHRRAEILAQIRADELKYNQGPGLADHPSSGPCRRPHRPSRLIAM